MTVNQLAEETTFSERLLYLKKAREGGGIITL